MRIHDLSINTNNYDLIEDNDPVAAQLKRQMDDLRQKQRQHRAIKAAQRATKSRQTAQKSQQAALAAQRLASGSH